MKSFDSELIEIKRNSVKVFQQAVDRAKELLALEQKRLRKAKTQLKRAENQITIKTHRTN